MFPYVPARHPNRLPRHFRKWCAYNFMAAFWGRKFPISTSEQPCAHNQINKKMVLLTIPNLCDVFVAALGQIPAATVDRQSLSSGGGARSSPSGRGRTDARSSPSPATKQLTLKMSIVALSWQYSGAVPPFHRLGRTLLQTLKTLNVTKLNTPTQSSQ